MKEQLLEQLRAIQSQISSLVESVGSSESEDQEQPDMEAQSEEPSIEESNPSEDEEKERKKALYAATLSKKMK